MTQERQAGYLTTRHSSVLIPACGIEIDKLWDTFASSNPRHCKFSPGIICPGAKAQLKRFMIGPSNFTGPFSSVSATIKRGQST
jgi:hypothetical protein